MGILIFIIIVVFLLIVGLNYYDHQKEKEKQEREKIEIQQRADEKKRQKEYETNLLLSEVARQATLINDQTVLKAVKNDSYNGPIPQRWENGDTYNSIFPDRLLIISIAGINFKRGLSNCIGDFNGVILPDPKNDYDPNAIKIKNSDNKELGYIPENLTQIVRDFIGHSDVENDAKWRHRITGHISDHYDWNYDTNRERRYFTGYINITNQEA